MRKIIFDNQFNAAGIQNLPQQSETIYVVIAKPTKFCNADCSYCSSPPDQLKTQWSLNDFKRYFDKIYPYMANGAIWIWHGGEPMLLGVDFYQQAYEYAKSKMSILGKNIYFSMQTNLLGYTKKWYPVFSNIFRGSISTSFDPDETQRTIKGNAFLYSKIFTRSLTNVLNDGFRPMVIGVYKEETAHLMHSMYEMSLSFQDKAFPLRFNYCHPTGRLETTGEAIKPETYGFSLIDIYNRWIKDAPSFTITPLDQMFKKVIGIDGIGHCPWTKKCGGRFIEIEPNGDIYNCADFADLGKKYCFGNLNDKNTIIEMLNTKPALQIRRRSSFLPQSCLDCEHFNDCEGGCMRDATLYKHGLYGKFHYCKSWKMVFARIKESILNNEADSIIKKYNCNPEIIKHKVKYNIQSHFNYSNEEMNQILLNKIPSIYGYGKSYIFSNDIFHKYDPEFSELLLSKANNLLNQIKIKIEN